jgi:hypothetical protein
MNETYIKFITIFSKLVHFESGKAMVETGISRLINPFGDKFFSWFGKAERGP